MLANGASAYFEVPGGPEVKHFDGFTSRRAAQPQRAPHPYNEICETLQANFRTEGQLAVEVSRAVRGLGCLSVREPASRTVATPKVRADGVHGKKIKYKLNRQH